jgi:hexosaminidase
MKTSQAVEYMVYPRMQALAEVVWTGSKRPDFGNFLTRLQPHVAWMIAEGMQPADPFQQT